MNAVFLKILNMSISAGWIVLAVLLLRLLLKKAPRWLSVLLWAMVAVRLICPFSLESPLSLLPGAETVSPDIGQAQVPQINSGVPVIDGIINPVMGDNLTATPTASANPLQILIPILAAVWIVGVGVMLAYVVFSYLRVQRKVEGAVLLQDHIYQSERVISPFVLGLIKPRIYLPFGMNEQSMTHVIAHERAHLARRDHLWKPLGFLLLAVYWFNPLLWLGYVLLCRDIELACDEKVIKKLNREERADYSEALLTCSVNRRMIAACPLAFGEVGVKQRIKSVLHYKKPAFGIILVAVILLIAAAVCLLTDPVKETEQDPSDTVFSGADIDAAYQFRSSDPLRHATLQLFAEDNQFSFTVSLLDSYWPRGTYEETDDYIILHTHDGKNKYIFKKQDESLIFLAALSSPMPRFSYAPGALAEVCVPDGAVFEKTDAET